MTEPELSECWLSSRTESVNTDFDGRLRRCRVVAQVGTDPTADVLLVEAEPPLPGQAAGGLVTLRRRWAEDRWQDTGERWVAVFVGSVASEVAARLRKGMDEALTSGDVRSHHQGEIAASADLLPPTPEHAWEEAYEALVRFAAREGHARVPPGHREGDLGLGIWVSNLRYDHAEGRLSPQQRERLEALPGWEW